MAVIAVGGCDVGATSASVEATESDAGGTNNSPSTGRGWRALAVQQRLPQLGISLDPLSLLRKVLKMAAKKFARGFPLPRRGPNSKRD